MKRTRHTRKPKSTRRSPRGKDRLSAARRSWNMSRIKGRNTSPELRVRSLLHRLGYRFCLHVRIPIQFGTHELRKRTSGALDSRIRFVRPDLILPKHRLAVFVHGCFWHRHRGCRNCTTPTNHRAFWVKKLNANSARDKIHQHALRRLGWRTLVVWECETEKPKQRERLRARLARTLSAARKPKTLSRGLRS